MYKIHHMITIIDSETESLLMEMRGFVSPDKTVVFFSSDKEAQEKCDELNKKKESKTWE